MEQQEEKQLSMREHVRTQAVGYIAAAFGFVAGLAWNDAIKALIEDIFPVSKNTVLAKFSYAILVTVFVAVITGYLLHMMNKKQ